MTDDPADADTARSAAHLDVDVRFLLANERTLLAWLRTGLTLMAGGVALVHFGETVHWLLRAAGIALIVLGIAASAQGLRRAKRADVAIRAGELPVVGRGPVFITAGVGIIGVAVAIGYLLAWR